MDRNWKLGDDVHEQDQLLDGFTYDTIITMLVCNEPVIDSNAVMKSVKELLELQLQDMYFLVENNMSEIIRAALDRRN